MIANGALNSGLDEIHVLREENLLPSRWAAASNGLRSACGLLEVYPGVIYFYDLHSNLPFLQKLINRFLASGKKPIIINNDVAIVDDVVVQGFKASLGRLVPVTIDSQQRDIPYTITVRGEGILKPTFNDYYVLFLKMKSVEQ